MASDSADSLLTAVGDEHEFPSSYRVEIVAAESELSNCDRVTSRMASIDGSGRFDYDEHHNISFTLQNYHQTAVYRLRNIHNASFADSDANSDTVLVLLTANEITRALVLTDRR